MAGQLKAPQGQQRHETTDVKTIGGWIKPAVNGARLIKVHRQIITTGHLREQPPRLKFAN